MAEALITFGGESPANYEQKCLCVLCLDVSGSMDGQAIRQLNEALRDFQNQILKDETAASKLELAIVTFESVVELIQPPALMDSFRMPVLQAQGSTALADGMMKSMMLVEARKEWYKSSGQNYYRPFIVLITDGEPDPDQDEALLQKYLQSGLDERRFSFFAVGVEGANMKRLARICPPQSQPMKLQGLNFSAFFQWLSNSMSKVSQSRSGDVIRLDPPNGWAQMEV